MKTRAFIEKLEHERITAAIVEAERLSTGQIRVFISHRAVEDVLPAARARFRNLGMEKTAARNAVLVYFSPLAHKYAVVGDEGIHAKVGGDGFWREVVDGIMAPLLKAEKFTEAIVAAIGTIGHHLAEHFPATGEARANELPDTIEEG